MIIQIKIPMKKLMKKNYFKLLKKYYAKINYQAEKDEELGFNKGILIKLID